MRLWLRWLTLAVGGLALTWSVSFIQGQAAQRGGAAAPAPAAAGRGAAPAAAATPAPAAQAAASGVTTSGTCTPASLTGTGRGAANGPQTKAGVYFKNVCSTTLKELTVDDFISSMGVISAALGYDCADCHPGAGTDKVDFAIDTIQQKKTARRMIEMVADINSRHFAVPGSVTCWTCHRQQERPATSIALDHLYDAPYPEDPDVGFLGGGGLKKLTATQIIDNYIQAVGGAQRLAGLTSWVATGVSDGYGGFGGEGKIEIYAKAPNLRTTIINFPDHPERGDSIWTVDGKRGFVKTPRGFLGNYELVGEELIGQNLEAMLAFPGQIRQTLTNFHTVLNRQIGDKDYLIVQANGPKGQYRDELATFYFDEDTGLLRRLVRMGTSPVGHVPVQLDYLDYRDVNGIKFPFEIRFSWLDGRYAAKIKDIKTNIAIDAGRFGEAAIKNSK